MLITILIILFFSRVQEESWKQSYWGKLLADFFINQNMIKS